MAKVFFRYPLYRVFPSNSYGTIFVKEYNNMFEDSFAILEEYSVQPKTETRKFAQKQVKIFYDDDSISSSTVIQNTYLVFKKILQDLELLLEHSYLEVSESL